MSTALAVAGVTAVLRGMLEGWLQVQGANAALSGASATVSAIPPDTVVLQGSEAGPRLNLFLHQVSPNPGWRNRELPSTDTRGIRITAPPLAIDLHYLLTAYGPEELQAEVLLGYGMQLLHELPVLDRTDIEDRLPQALRSSGLGRQVELIKITPEPMGTEELSKLWTAMQAKYRPTAAYHVSVVLIESSESGNAALPVLTRGPRDPVSGLERGVQASATTMPGLPGITAVAPPGGQSSALLGDSVRVEGHHLAGTGRAVRLENRRLEIDREVAAVGGTEHDSIGFAVPNTPAALAVGTYAISALVQPPGEPRRRESNQLSITIAPRIMTALPLQVARDGQGRATIDLDVRPNVRPHQQTSLIVGGTEVAAEPHPATTGSLQFIMPDAPAGSHLLRIRVDGIDSQVVDRSVSPPVFFDRRVEIS